MNLRGNENSEEYDEILVKIHHINFVWFDFPLSAVGNINILPVHICRLPDSIFLILVAASLLSYRIKVTKSKAFKNQDYSNVHDRGTSHHN